MTEFTMDRLRKNLESLKMKNTLEILDNYLERAVAENLNSVDVLGHIFAEEAKSKRERAYEKQICTLNVHREVTDFVNNQHPVSGEDFKPVRQAVLKMGFFELLNELVAVDVVGGKPMLCRHKA